MYGKSDHFDINVIFMEGWALFMFAYCCMNLWLSHLTQLAWCASFLITLNIFRFRLWSFETTNYTVIVMGLQTYLSPISFCFQQCVWCIECVITTYSRLITHDSLSHYSSCISAQQMSGLTFFVQLVFKTIRSTCQKVSKFFSPTPSFHPRGT